MNTNLDGIKVVFLDLDGTIYLGNNLIHGALDFLTRCDERGIRRFFLSNNSSRSVKQYMTKLENFGIDTVVEDVMLSTHHLIAWLDKNGYRRVYLIGTNGMRDMLESNGLIVDSEEPEIVVLGYDTEINYDKISKAAIHLQRGIPLVASHPDIVCPSEDGGLPDVGAYLAMFETATGVKPIHICGKPNAGMIRYKIEELGLHPSDCAMVGDRLYTDMEMAIQAGCVSVLVLSGEATMGDVEDVVQKPDIIVDSIADLLLF